MRTINIPTGIFLQRFHMPGKTEEQFERAADIASDVLSSGKVELDMVDLQLHIFTDCPRVHELLLYSDKLPMAVIGTLIRARTNIHGPGCTCAILPPSKRQGMPHNTPGAKA